MDTQTHIASCQICGNNQFSHKLSCIDYTVSRETFNLVSCNSCGFVFTNPRPNQDSIGKYYQSADYISHSATKKGLINTLYHIVRRKTLKSKYKLIKSLAIDSNNVLDIGAGTGDFLNHMNKSGFVTSGIEPDTKAREQAIKKHELNIYDIETFFKLPAQSFDFITMWHVLEHVSDLHEYATNIMRILKPKGYLIIAVPNYESADAKHYKAKWAAYDVPRHLSHFSIETMEKYLSKYGFEIIQKKPMPFDAFYVSMLTEKNINNNGVLDIITGFVWGSITLVKGLFSIKNYSSIIYIAQKKS